jgi:hypothetical protein
MKKGLSDTHPEIEEMRLKLLREMPGWRKLQLMAQMSQAVKRLALIGLRERYPDDPPEKIKRRLADLMLGEELAERAFGPLEEDEKDENNTSEDGSA